jgi:putative transcriptional regulator
MDPLKGAFLVAEPSLLDPNFRASVVLILEHNPGGAYGVVVNRPAEDNELPLPVFIGGPCPSPGLVMLHSHPEWISSSSDDETLSPDDRALAPGIYIGDAASLNIATKIIPGKPIRFRIFRNYAGWGGGQLEQEIAAKAWTVVPATADLLFDVPPNELWPLLRPRHIPEPSVN